MTDQTVTDCTQCKSRLTSGKRCKRTTCLYSDYCWQHGRKTQGLAIKSSTIAGAGKGLFAARDLPKGFLIPYEGILMSKKEVDRKYPGDVTAQYVVCASKKTCYDASSTQAGYGRWANHASKGPNAQWFKKRDTSSGILKIYIKLKRDVPKGTEILVDYGDDYWS